MKKYNSRTEVKIFNDEMFRGYTDHELQNIMAQLRHDREACASKGKDTKPIEIEICYLQREFEFRNYDRMIQSYSERDQRPQQYNAHVN